MCLEQPASHTLLSHILNCVTNRISVNGLTLNYENLGTIRFHNTSPNLQPESIQKYMSEEIESTDWLAGPWAELFLKEADTSVNLKNFFLS